MATCEVCGNDDDRAFAVHAPDGDVHSFDTYECAIHALAPVCEQCGCRIIGHGMEVGGHIFCCATCARGS